MLPDGIGRTSHHKARQQQDLCEAEAIETTLGEALDKGIGTDGAIHYLLAVGIKPPVYAFMDFSLKPKRETLDG